MNDDALHRLTDHGVAVWLDHLDRRDLDSGKLERQIAGRRVTGVTTNPTIFRNALDGNDAYQAQLGELARRGADTDGALLAVTTTDVRRACDLLMPIHRRTGGSDGHVSIEVDPRLAHDAAATVAQAQELRIRVDRPNVLVKIPATTAGLEALTRTTALGISVNMTLLFSLTRYQDVLHAYARGLRAALAGGLDLGGIASVASFFVSRLDTETDARLAALGGTQAAALRGQAALANARLAYRIYEQEMAREHWQRLQAQGARPQKPLWASTGTKNPAYDDTRYVTGLVAPGTVSTMPQATLDAVADHAVIDRDLRDLYGESAIVLDELAAAGIDYDQVTRELEEQGLRQFTDAWLDLRETVRSALEEAH
ncbi:transaldolase [Streptomyces sp. NPDC057950]|uniref:transaldolase n=1 Tax=Streptomyces sp. NPDC057950 TaxID=3346288 RepID=UPI0036ED5C31